MKSFESVGTICLKGQNNFIYKICKITYRLFEDESFEYVFEPNYFLIDLLDSKYFQGIPGLNLDLKNISEKILFQPLLVKEYLKRIEKIFMSY